MSNMKCNGCGGIFESVQSNGQGYAHTCPPGTPAINLVNQNPPSILAADANKVIAAGAGVAASAVPPIVPTG